MQIVKFHFIFIYIFCFVLLCSCCRGQASEIMFCDCPYKRLKKKTVHVVEDQKQGADLISNRMTLDGETT